jgi:c-di-GMP-binding flagellar brake protein YcgR
MINKIIFSAKIFLCIFFLLLTPFLSKVNLTQDIYAVDNAQRQFLTGLNSIFSGTEQGRLGWGRSALYFFLIFLAGSGATGVLFLFVNFLRARRRKIEIFNESQNIFAENAQKLGLNLEEREKLISLLRHQNVLEPHTIFHSIYLFEQCIDSEVKEIIKEDKNISPDDPRVAILADLRKKLGFSHLPYEHPLISTRNITIGQTGSLFGKEVNRPIFNKVVVVDNNSLYFTVQYNLEKEEPYRITENSIVRFVFARQNDGLYGVETRVVGIREAGSLDLLHTLDLKRNQLRQYVRVETNLPLRFRLLSTKNPDKSEIQRGVLVNAKMMDISGGGLSFICEKSLRLGDLISLSFDLPSQSFVGIIGKVVHLTLKEGKTGTIIKHHIQFINLELRKRESIIKYVFEKERQLSQWR